MGPAVNVKRTNSHCGLRERERERKELIFREREREWCSHVLLATTKFVTCFFVCIC
jgi:hypothetical protein